MKPNEFMALIVPLAQRDMEKTGILASLTIAQAIVESRWGDSDLARMAHNYFGIKGNYNGQSVFAPTKEIVNGKQVEIMARFKKYPGLAESVADHSNNFLSKSIYKAVVGERDYKRACRAVHAAGYATALDYADALIKRIEEHKLYQYDNIKTGGNKMAKVFLGVGHGGNDPGAMAGGIKEKDLNLGIALACRAELERHGVQVLMSRTKDENDTLTEEISECNAYRPDLAVDIHNNAGGGDGFEAYYSVLNTPNGQKSKELAAKIEAEVKAIGQNSRGLKTKVNASGNDWFGFVREPTCPSILIECAFVDSRDVQIVDTPAERDIMGAAVARGILKTLGIAARPQLAQEAYQVRVFTFTDKTGANAACAKIKSLGYYAQVEKKEG